MTPAAACFPPGSTLRAIRCVSAVKALSVADLCACLAETECRLTALHAATDGMTFAEEDDYLKRTDQIRTALYAEQQKLLLALATAPVRSASDIVELARVTVLLTADDVDGLQVLADNLDVVLYRVLRCVAAAPLTAVFGH